MWILRCLHHSIAIGMHVCVGRESVNDPIFTIYERFQKSPEVMCGDYNCKVMSGAMKKFYNFYNETIFVSDEMHHNSHTSCGDSFNVKHHKTPYNSSLMYINDSGVEQRNVIVNKIKKQLLYSNLTSFMMMIKLILIMDNRMIKRKIQNLPSLIS